MAKSHLALVTPATVIGTVEPSRRPPKRLRNAEVRAREYLTSAEVDRLVKAAGAAVSNYGRCAGSSETSGAAPTRFALAKSASASFVSRYAASADSARHMGKVTSSMTGGCVSP